MWPFKSAGTGTDPELLEALTKLRTRVTALEDDLANLADKHERLRGKVYATGQHRAPDAAAPAPGAKPTLMELGFRPGQPYPHK